MQVCHPAKVAGGFSANLNASKGMLFKKQIDMTDFKDLVQLRRSHRQFTPEPLKPDELQLILRAALMSPSAMHRRSWHFIVVDDKLTLEKLADAKPTGAQFLKEAPVAVVVTGEPDSNECWVEDCSIAAVTMQYQAADLGLGSCWAQMRGHGLGDGTSSDAVIHGILNLPENQEVLCVVAFGHSADERKPQDENALKWENVIVNS